MTVKTATKTSLVLAILCTLLLVYLTHASMVDLKKDFGGIIDFLGDKLLHVIAYAGLSTLYCLFTRFKFPCSGKSLKITLYCLVAFTVVDELTQAFFERSVDPFDLMCNFIGLSLGMLLSLLSYRLAFKLAIVK